MSSQALADRQRRWTVLSDMPVLAKAAAMTPFLERIEHQDPQWKVLDRILDDAAGHDGRFRKGGTEVPPAVVIADRQMDG